MQGPFVDSINTGIKSMTMTHPYQRTLAKLGLYK